MLPIDSIARVVVNVTDGSVEAKNFDTGALLVADANYADTKRMKIYNSSAEAIAGMGADGFIATSDPVKCAVKYFSASPAPSRLIVSCYPSTGNDAESPLEAVAALLDKTTDFYGLCFPSVLANADALALASGIQGMHTPLVAFIVATGDADAAVAAGSLLKGLFDAQAPRTVPFYSAYAYDIGALMGTAMGLLSSHPNTAFSLGLKPIYGVTPSDLTAAQVAAFEAINSNVYIVRGRSTMVLEFGNLATGERYHEQLYVDKIAFDLQQAAVDLIANNPDTLPQTDDTTTTFMNRFASILMGYTDAGVLASLKWRRASIGPVVNGDIVENGFAMWASTYDEQSDADRAAHKAVPINVALTFAGSVESIVIIVNVQL